MQYQRLLLSVILFLVPGLIVLHAQESVSATGGNASGSAGSVSYSIGQLTYQTHTGTDGWKTEGVQQPYEISVITSLEEAKGIYLLISAYPNPTASILTISIEEFDISGLSFQLFDMQGKLLHGEMIIGNQTSIFMGNLVPANYIVKIIQGSREIKTFKIIKN